ncbi:MAG: sigma-70 family RNA polymerase sigma factor [Xanthomonadales bacterium]|nr:sigma-70 family RNA polymerase sigma factor [Xanthomonadales bacterium]
MNRTLTHPTRERQPDSEPAAIEPVARRVAQARDGSQAACTWLYRRYLPLVHGVLLARFRPAIADELTQECFALAFQRLRQLREPAHFGAWVASIARHLRSPENHHEETMAEPFDVHDPSADPARQAEAWQLLAAIRSLPGSYAETLALRLVEGMSGAEIAQLTGLTPDSVRVNLHRGMRKLRELIGTAGAKET